MTPRSLSEGSNDSLSYTTPMNEITRPEDPVESFLPRPQQLPRQPRDSTPCSETTDSEHNTLERSMNPCALPFTPSPELARLSTPSPANGSHRHWLFRPPPPLDAGENDAEPEYGGDGDRLRSSLPTDGRLEVSKSRNLLLSANKLTQP